jgi:hypothetical protein
MEGNGYHYGYIMSSTEALGVSVGLWNFIEDYVNTHLRPVKNRRAASYHDAGLSWQGFVLGPKAWHPS